ncbi:hypothetical protein M1328_05095 [Patescibacteria group bacterium]|nr:hypothetical protein [Patescibacteria group bacterium]
MFGHKEWKKGCGGSSSAVYGLGFVGAAVYYLQHAHGFQGFVLAILKAVVWPALLLYKVLTMLKM